MADLVSTVAHVAPYIPEENIPMVLDALRKMPEDKLTAISMIQFKQPFTTTILAGILGMWGGDRFYLGQAGLGVLKFITGGGFGIWAIIDYFTSNSHCKKANYKTLQTYLY